MARPNRPGKATRPSLRAATTTAVCSRSDSIVSCILCSAMEAAAARGIVTAYPAFADHQESFRFLAGEPDEIGPWAIYQPSLEAPQVHPDLVLLPLVAVDRQGTRLGQGKGHYDRVVDDLRSRGALLIGVGWQGQMLESVIPTDPWDVPLDGFASPAGLEMFR